MKNKGEIINREEISASLDRYTEDAYKFAFILTFSEEGAVTALEDAVAEMTAKEKWGGDDEKIQFFASVFRHAKQCKTAPMKADEITEKYGRKSDDFYSMSDMPAEERARQHLLLYEDMSESDAEKVTGKRK